MAILDVLDYFALFGVFEGILVVLVGYFDHFGSLEGGVFWSFTFYVKKKRIFF